MKTAPVPCHVEVFLLPPVWDGTLSARRILVPADGPPDEAVRRALGRRCVLWAHSTSWRWHGGGVVLTYLVVLARAPRRIGESLVITTQDLRSQGQRDPRNPCAGECSPADALRHGLRHLAALCRRPDQTPCLQQIPRSLCRRFATLIADPAASR